MTFVSYAQNFEDVMLWRALKHVQNGVYVDVGAQHPIIDSVSKAFYEHGWRGVHIEPVPEYAELLRQDRPDETVLQVALSDTEGTLELNVIPDTGLSTAVDAYAQLHQVERGLEHQKTQVPVLTLKSALKTLVGKDVHWLKIDVEGFEEHVLKGWDSRIVRPWVMVVEATKPNSTEQDYASWDPILTAADYQFVYFDGLNRFYVAKEHAELTEAFTAPPNIFDEVQLSGLASWGLCQGLKVSHQAEMKDLATRIQAHVEWLQQGWDAAKQRTGQLEEELQAVRENEGRLQARSNWLRNEWDAAKEEINKLNQSSHHWWTVADGLNRELQGVYASTSWRITAPLRQAMQTAKWLAALPKRMAKPLVVWGMRQTLANPRLKAHMLDVLAKHPQLKQHLRQLAIRSGLITSLDTALPDSQPASVKADEPTGLSPRAARIYAELMRAIEARRG